MNVLYLIESIKGSVTELIFLSLSRNVLFSGLRKYKKEITERYLNTFYDCTVLVNLTNVND